MNVCCCMCAIYLDFASQFYHPRIQDFNHEPERKKY